MPFQGYVCFELALLVLCRGRPDSSLLALDFAKLGLALSIRSYTHTGLSVLASDPLHIGLPISSRSLTCLDLVLPALTGVRMGSLLLASDFVHLGLIMFVQSLGSFGFASLFHSFACVELVSLPVGLSKTDFTSPALDLAASDSSTFVRSSAYLELSFSALDFLHLDFSSLVRGLG